MKNLKSLDAFLCTCIALSVTSCAMVKETYIPDGAKGYSISCDGAAVGINVCFEKAGELCKEAGYDLINREGQMVPYGIGTASLSGNSSQYQGQGFVTYGSFNTKSIMVKCRK
ncbi:MAG: hypothetical protein P8171_19005 [Candidatus Thiodiazotropha sp.]